jgi:hypothetical protein
MIPEFDNEGRAEIALNDGRSISIINEKRTRYIKRELSTFFDPAKDTAAADSRSYEVAFGRGDTPDREYVPDGWAGYEDERRSDVAWRIFGHVPKEVVHTFLDEHTS